ncbi:MAG TPA: diguanylate cyclase [Solimonas sp.]|nr:diguanylate cyclase [Solimonas sp.]
MNPAGSGWLSGDGFLPHGYCFAWSPELLWSMVVSDVVTGLAYYAIPVTLIAFVRRRKDLRFNSVFLLFGAFIFACGTTHFIDLLNIWYPAYWLDAQVKLATAAISLTTAIMLVLLLPKIHAWLDERAQAQLALQTANRELEHSLSLLERRGAELEELGRVSDQLQGASDPNEFASTLQAFLQKLLPAAAGELVLTAGPTDSGETRRTWSVQLADVVPATGRVEAPDSRDWVLPLAANNEDLGQLRLQVPVAGNDPYNAQLLLSVAQRASMALANIRLRESLTLQSWQDPLTGLFNRRYLTERLGFHERARTRATNGFAVVLFDMDHFKRLNDRHGHDSGDEALRAFADVLRASVRSGDVACRYGGEEFVLILPGIDLRSALARAEQIRRAVQRVALKDREGRSLGPLSVSAGVAASPQHGETWDEVIARADHALYRAKENGRDRVECEAA